MIFRTSQGGICDRFLASSAVCGWCFFLWGWKLLTRRLTNGFAGKLKDRGRSFCWCRSGALFLHSMPPTIEHRQAEQKNAWMQWLRGGGFIACLRGMKIRPWSTSWTQLELATGGDWDGAKVCGCLAESPTRVPFDATSLGLYARMGAHGPMVSPRCKQVWRIPACISKPTGFPRQNMV